MKRTPLAAWFAYALTGLIVTTLIAVVGVLLVEGNAARAVWTAAGVAYGIQLLAFGLLLWLRGQPHLFMAAWLGGMVLRFAVLGLGAYWLSRTAALPRGTTLISFVGFVFLLLLLEPVFLRWDLRES